MMSCLAEPPAHHINHKANVSVKLFKLSHKRVKFSFLHHFNYTYYKNIYIYIYRWEIVIELLTIVIIECPIKLKIAFREIEM